MNWLNRIVHFLTIATRLTWAAAVPLLAWLFGVLFLVWPPQTVDLLTNETWIQAFAYHVAVAIWSISCWFWARWSLNLQPVGFPERLEPNRVQVETEVETLVTNNRDVAQPG